jgi:hypothetical protein
MESLPSELEMAVLEHIAQAAPPLRPTIGTLRVCRRELTGAGSYTYFAPTVPVVIPDGYITLSSLILMPGVAHGMGAALAVTSGYPEFLEIFTFGEHLWSGVDSGFAIVSGGA